MGQKTLTRADLADAVVQKVGLPRNESQEIVERILGEISGALTDGEGVKLSSFGSFDIRSKGERIGRNPKTGEEVPITPRRVLVFRPSNIMKERINTVLARSQKAACSSLTSHFSHPLTSMPKPPSPPPRSHPSAGSGGPGGGRLVFRGQCP